MSFGYLGDTSTKIKQQVKNQGVISVSEAYELEKKGHLGGSLELIEEQTYSSAVSAVDFTSIKGAKYNVHFLTWANVDFASEELPALRFFESGVLETASVYQYARQTGQTDGTFAESKSTAFGGIPIDVGMTNKQSQGYIYFYNLGNSAKYSFATLQSFIEDYGFSFGGGVLPQTSAVDGIRFRNVDTANITGTLKLYGVKQ